MLNVSAMTWMDATVTAPVAVPGLHDELATWLGTGFMIIMSLLCLMLLWKMWRNEINICGLLEEANGQASMSRFQLLVFTLVIAVGLFLYILKTSNLPQVDSSILTLLGISASTYAAGKGISFSRPEGVVKQPGTPGCEPATPPAPTGDPVVDSSAAQTPVQGS